MKHLFLSRSFLFCISIALFGACTQEDYSLNTELCVVKKSGDLSLCLLSDQGNVLYPTSSLDAEIYKEGQRYNVTYKVMEGSVSNQVNIFNMQPVLIKDAVSRALFTGSMGDLVWLVSKPWIGGGYLNFEFSYGYSDSNIKHGIYLVQETSANGNAGKNIYLTFGHDANGDATEDKATALVSFPFTSVLGIQDADSLIVNVLEGTVANPKQKTYRLAVPDEVKAN